MLGEGDPAGCGVISGGDNRWRRSLETRPTYYSYHTIYTDYTDYADYADYTDYTNCTDYTDYAYYARCTCYACCTHQVATIPGDAMGNGMLHLGYWGMSQPEELGWQGGVSLPTAATLGRPPVLLDIGANQGFISLRFAKAGWRVVSVEAMSQNVRAIRTSLDLNPDVKPRMQVVTAALGRASLAGCHVVGDANGGGASNGEILCGKQAAIKCAYAPRVRVRTCEPVTLTTLDRLLTQLNVTAIDAVKMDVEGYECEVPPLRNNLHPPPRPPPRRHPPPPLHPLPPFLDGSHRLAATHRIPSTHCLPSSIDPSHHFESAGVCLASDIHPSLHGHRCCGVGSVFSRIIGRLPYGMR